MKQTIIVYSKGLYDTITTLHEPKEYRLRKTVSSMRNAFESAELDAISWIKGKKNVVGLIKYIPILWDDLNVLLKKGLW